MKLNVSLFIVIPLLALGPFATGFCQDSPLTTDSTEVPVNGKLAKANELFFDAVKAKAHNDNKRACELFEQFVVAEPKSAAAYYELSRLYTEEKKLQKAEDNILKAVALVKDNKWYNEQYANVLAIQGKYTEAAKQMADLAEKEPSDVNYAIIAAEYFEKAKKYMEALSYIDKALLRSGDDEEILMRKVQIYLQMNEVEKAAGVIRTIISQDPKNGKYYRLLGELYDNNKMPAKALQVFLDAEKIISDDPLIEIGLEEHYLNLKDTVKYREYTLKAINNTKLDIETQIELFQTYMQTLSDSAGIKEGKSILATLLTQHPADPGLISIYGKFLEADHQLEKAVVEYKKSLAIKPANFAVWQDLLNAYSEKVYADSLIKYSEKAIRLFPNQALAHYYNALGHYNKKEYPKAINAVKRAVEMTPDTDAKGLAGMYSFLGDIYNTTKQYDESDKSFDKALELEPSDASVLNNYSYFLAERGKNLDKAKRMSEKSLAIRPNETTFLDTYGWVLYKTGDYEKAKIFIEKAVTANDKNADATLYEHLGDIYYKLNDKAKALQYWKQAKEKGSENPLLVKKISEEKLYE